MVDVSGDGGVGKVQNLEGTRSYHLGLLSDILPVQSY
jgi:hypothetical protein